MSVEGLGLRLVIVTLLAILTMMVTDIGLEMDEVLGRYITILVWVVSLSISLFIWV